jgi:hypothetical protein
MKITTALGRQLMRDERQRLAQEQALQAERMVNEANALREAKFRRDEPKVPKQQTLVNRSVVRRTAAVLASEEVVVPIRVRQGDEYTQTKAWTDFKCIDITFEPEDDIRLLSAQLRGLLYHEGGHCRFTDPFLDLVEAVREVLGDVPTPDGINSDRLHRAWNCLEDQRMETAVVSDAPRKAAFFTPMVMAMHLKSLDHMAANWPLLVWRKYLPMKLRRQARLMFVTLHGTQGEHFAQELDRIVTSYVTATDVETMWAAVCEYHVLLQAMKPLASNMDDAGHTRQRSRKDSGEPFKGLSIPIDPSMLDDTPAMSGDDFQDDLDDEDVDMPWTEEGFEHFLDILFTLLNGGDVFEVRYVDPRMSSEPDEQEQEQGVGDLGDEEEQPGSKEGSDEESGEEEAEEGSKAEAGDDDATDEADQDADEAAGDGVPTVDQEADADDEHDGADESDDDSDDVAGDKGGDHIDHGGSTGSHSDTADTPEEGEPFTQEDLDELLQEAEEERNQSSDLDGDVQAYGDAETNSVSDLDVYIGGISTNTELIVEAETLASQIEDAFHAHTMDRAPAWVEQQRRGVLNVGRYMTRNPGDLDFFKQYTDSEQPGFDLAVTVMLDYSWSMADYSERLAQAGYACKLACDKLEIPCTVVLWDTKATTLWDASEQADSMPTIDCVGGTKPDMALADLDNHRMDRDKHIVLIMTDGEWGGGWRSNERHLSFYKDPGRKMLGFGYGSDRLARTLLGYGCDEAFAITDLMDIPHKLEEVLLEMV